MKLIQMYGATKTIYYFGLSLEVPDWVAYIAVDSYGNLFGFDDENTPWKTKDGLWDSDGRCDILAKVDLNGSNWEQSLLSYK